MEDYALRTSAAVTSRLPEMCAFKDESPAPDEQRSGPLANDEYSSSVDLSEKDLAATFVPSQAQEYDRAIERRTLRKLDLFLIPWMWIVYGFVYYDKVSSAIAAIETSVVY